MSRENEDGIRKRCLFMRRCLVAVSRSFVVGAGNDEFGGLPSFGNGE